MRQFDRQEIDVDHYYDQLAELLERKEKCTKDFKVRLDVCRKHLDEEDSFHKTRLLGHSGNQQAAIAAARGGRGLKP